MVKSILINKDSRYTRYKVLLYSQMTKSRPFLMITSPAVKSPDRTLLDFQYQNSKAPNPSSTFSQKTRANIAITASPSGKLRRCTETEDDGTVIETILLLANQCGEVDISDATGTVILELSEPVAVGYTFVMLIVAFK